MRKLRIQPVTQTALYALGLSTPSVPENTGAGVVVGAITNRTTGSTLSLIDGAGSRFALSGANITTGATATDYETNQFHDITVREVKAPFANRDSVIRIFVTNVFEAANLGALALSSASYTNGASTSGTITGATGGSTISILSGAPAGFTINSAARTWAFDGSAGVGSGNITLRETLADSANSPRDTVIAWTVAVGSSGEPILIGGQSPYLSDPDGVAVAAPYTGQPLSLFVGGFTNGPTSWDWQVYDANGNALQDVSGTLHTADVTAGVSNEPIYVALDSDIGGPLSVSVIAHNGIGPSLQANSAATGNVADPVLDVPVLTKTSGANTLPLTFDIGWGTHTYAGPNWLGAIIVKDPSDNSIKLEITKELTNLELAGTESYFDGGYSPDPDPAILTYTNGAYQLFAELRYLTPNGRQLLSGYSTAIMANDIPAYAGVVAWAASTGYTRTGSNLITTRGSSGSAIDLADTARVDGFFELIVNNIAAGEDNFGFAVGLGDLGTNNWLGIDGHSIGFHKDGWIWYGGGKVMLGGALSNGDRIGVAVKKDGSLVPRAYFKLNGAYQDGKDPSLNNGIDISGMAAFYPAVSAAASGTQVTGHFAPSNVVDSAPGVNIWGS